MKKVGLIIVVALMSMTLYAGVNLKNGNFFISYTDIVVPGGANDLEITRTYNSKSTEKGWFGYGWGSDFETRLVVSADGSVVIHEHGAGAMTRFTPKSKVDAAGAATKIVESMRQKTSLSDKVAKDLMDKLKNDAELRHAYAQRFKVSASLAEGSILESSQRGYQTVKRVKEGYRRSSSNGKEETFSTEGKLLTIKDKNGYKVNFSYDKAGVLTSIKDSDAKQIFFSWYSDGKVKEIWSAGDKKATYKYKGDDLVESVNVGGTMFTYEYDQNHNMTTVGYRDGTKMKVAYGIKTQFAEKIENRNGSKVVYDYGADPKNPDLHYWTEVTKSSPGGKPVKNRYEYEIRKRNDGSTYTYKIATQIAGIKTETLYDSANGLPSKITRGKHVTNFKYNNKGLLVKKDSTKGDNVELQYHPDLNKITYVKNKRGWTKFDYDKKGNLVKAVDNSGRSVLLIYDRKGRIAKMVEAPGDKKEKRTLKFVYNALGKPVEIAMDKVGKINVMYDNYGEIKKVESKQGQKMALQVTQAFQSLLSIVKPAGVNLNF